MKPICTKCRRFFTPEKNGFTFLEGMPTGLTDCKGNMTSAKPGLAEPERWQPYKLWRGDLWKCYGCGHEIVVGCALQPLSEHYLPDFKELCEHFKPELQVNDC